MQCTLSNNEVSPWRYPDYKVRCRSTLSLFLPLNSSVGLSHILLCLLHSPAGVSDSLTFASWCLRQSYTRQLLSPISVLPCLTFSSRLPYQTPAVSQHLDTTFHCPYFTFENCPDWTFRHVYRRRLACFQEQIPNGNAENEILWTWLI
jgi:hypothetical protein